MNINKINKKMFNSLIHVTHWLTESEGRNVIGKPVSRMLGGLTLRVKKGARKASIEEAAKEWQRMFPSRKMVPIVKIEDDTVFAEIRSECPYRDSGNVDGCYRMMEYDRKMMESIGADFVVLKSQATEGVNHCQIAITNNLENRADLIPANHQLIETTEVN